MRTLRHTLSCTSATLLLALTPLPAAAAAGAELALTIEPIGEAKGTLQIAIYASEQQFRKKPLRAIKLPATAGTMTLRVPDMPPGDYAVMVFHDRNGNDRFDTNVMGIPKEPWGASIGEKAVFGAPGWTDARFAVRDGSVAVRIRLND
jgi:uncharacterized protein (DUF2141 family)